MCWSYLDSPGFISLSLHLMTCFEIPVHVLGVYCILFQTPDSMKSVKRSMLNLHVWSVLLDLGISLMTTPYVLFPAIAGFPLGVLKEFGVSTAAQIWLIVYLFATVGVAILGIFENRYFLLLTEITTSRWRHLRVPFLVTMYLLALLFFIPPYLHIPDQPMALRQVLELLPELPTSLRREPIFVLSIETTYIKCSVGGFTVVVLLQCLFFILSLFFRLKNQVMVSQRATNLQKRFLNAMYVQVFLPMAVIVIPIVYFHLSVFFAYYNQALNNCAFLIVAFHGLLSTLIMLTVHKPYREFCWKWFGGRRKASRASGSRIGLAGTL